MFESRDGFFGTRTSMIAPRWYRDLDPNGRRAFRSTYAGFSMDAMNVQLYSFILPLLLIADMLGFPPESYDDLLRWSDDMIRGTTINDEAAIAKSHEAGSMGCARYPKTRPPVLFPSSAMPSRPRRVFSRRSSR